MAEHEWPPGGRLHTPRLHTPRLSTPIFMAAQPPTEKRAIIEDLERRLDKFDKYPDDTFGHFTAIDFIVSGLLFLVLPIAIIWYLR